MVVRGAEYDRLPRDAYMTPRPPIIALLKNQQFTPRVCDPCCGDGGLIRVLKDFQSYSEQSYSAIGFDIDPWLNAGQYPQLNFLKDTFPYTNCDIVTNPPYGVQGRMALKFIERALSITSICHGKVAMLLPADFDSGKTRQHVFRNCTAWCKKIVLLDRIHWFGNQGGSTNFDWCVWDWQNNKPPTIEYAECSSMT